MKIIDYDFDDGEDFTQNFRLQYFKDKHAYKQRSTK